jgi:hypothetical protein
MISLYKLHVYLYIKEDLGGPLVNCNNESGNSAINVTLFILGYDASNSAVPKYIVVTAKNLILCRPK